MNRTAPPGYPNTYSTPSSCRHRTTISAPVNSIPVFRTAIFTQNKRERLNRGVCQVKSASRYASARHGSDALRIFDNIVATLRNPAIEEPVLASRNELSEFLASVERRAFKQARFAVRDDDAALDIVQDSMLKLSEKYGGKACEELPMLFQRILQNTIRDFYRRQKVRSLWTTLFSTLSAGRDDDQSDFLETLEAEQGSNGPVTPADHLEKAQLVEFIEKELQRLPARQREAFLLRYWEEMDVAETAAIMGCSQGSVKTHCSRATSALATALRARGIEP